MTIYVDNLPSNSSFYRALVENLKFQYDVDIIRLDDVIKESLGHAFLKLDVQGNELDVICGCDKILANVDLIMLEKSVISQSESVPELADVVSFMHARGYVVYDMVGGTKRPLDGALAQIDLIFLRHDHPLRTDKRWRNGS